MLDHIYHSVHTLYGILGSDLRLKSGKTGVVLIFGGSNILGKRICQQLLFNEQISVVNIDTSDFNGISQPLPGRYTFIQCKNLCDTKSCEHSLMELKQKVEISKIRIFINNMHYGIASESSSFLDIQNLQDTVVANLTNVLIITKSLLRAQTVSSRLYIINVSIRPSHWPFDEHSMHFITTKAGLNQAHDALASEMSSTNNKALLLYLPATNSFEDGQIAWQTIAHQLIKHLKNGRSGELQLSC